MKTTIDTFTNSIVITFDFDAPDGSGSSSLVRENEFSSLYLGQRGGQKHAELTLRHSRENISIKLIGGTELYDFLNSNKDKAFTEGMKFFNSKTSIGINSFIDIAEASFDFGKEQGQIEKQRELKEVLGIFEN